MLTSLPRDGDVAPKVFEAVKTDGEMPFLGLKVLIVGNCFRAGAIRMFNQAGCTPAENVETAELVVFLGGEDVDPTLYGEKTMKRTYANPARDAAEVEVFELAVMHDVPMFGICRGMQFLHVMNGGKLYQHVENHAGRDHLITDLRTGEEVMVSSMHHQMCIENTTTIPLAYAKQAGQGAIYHTYGSELASNKHNDLEAAVYPDIGAICVQGHPEVEGTPRYRAWCLEKIASFLEDKKIGDNWKSREDMPTFLQISI